MKPSAEPTPKRMKHLYILTAAALVAASASAQSTKDPDGNRAEARGLKVEGRALPWVNDQRGGGPGNNDCTGAITMTVNSSCVSVNGTLAGATESMPAATCSGFTASAANDVWFTFVATAASTTISVTGAATTADPDTLGIDPVLEVFSGDCGTLTSLGCLDATLPAGTTEEGALATTPGTTYYYRVYYWPYGGPPTDFSFTTCVFSLAAPANDDCAGAIAVTPLAFCGPLNYSGVGATESLAAITCNGFTGNANDDIWFSFVASQTTMTIGATGAPGTGADNVVYDAVVEAFDGCGGTSLGCADATLSAETESLELTGLTIGNTYYFRVYHYYTPAADPATVGVCVVEGGGISIGIAEVATERDWVLYPNPAASQVRMNYNGVNGQGRIELFDVAGRSAMVLNRSLVKNSVNSFDVQHLSAGVYTARLTVNGQRTEQRLVIE